MKHSKIKGPAFRAKTPTAGSRGTPTLEQAAQPGLVMEEKGILYGQGGWDRPRPPTDPELRGKALLGSARGHSPPGEWVRIGLGEAEPGARPRSKGALRPCAGSMGSEARQQGCTPWAALWPAAGPWALGLGLGLSGGHTSISAGLRGKAFSDLGLEREAVIMVISVG